jgi:DNA-binding helix-hairpin-helix protein with protein kinase domain
VDHLFRRPMLTAAFTVACCNKNGPAIPSGGLWVVEPSQAVWDDMWRMMEEGKPRVDDRKGEIVLKPDGTPEREYWHWGDMQVRADCT